MIDGAGLDLMREKLPERLNGKLAQTFTLGPQPLLEGRLLNADSLQQVPAVERRRLLERLGRPFGRQLLERGHIDVNRARIDADGVRPLYQAGGVSSGQGLAQRDEHLPQTVTSALIRRVAPQERRQFVTRLHLPDMEREVGQERFRLLPGKTHDGPGIEPRLEGTEENEPQRGHQRVRGL